MIAGLILAAGAGTRFGSQAKLLAEFRGRPLLEHAVAAQCAVPELRRVVVVLGARADELLGAVAFGRAQPVLCAEWETGQSASLRCGVLAAGDDADRVIVTLGDEPTLIPAVIARFLDQPGGARAGYDGRPGHPVVLGPDELDALRGLRGDEGARSLLKGPQIECSDLCRPHDVDTPEDLEAIRHEARAVV